MNSNITITEQGTLDIFHKYPTHEEHVLTCHNDAVNTGASVAINALAGNGGIKYLYVAYMNGTDTIVYPNISASTTITAFTGLTGSYGCIKVPAYLIGAVADNTAIIQGITSEGKPLNNSMAGIETGSKIIAVGLVGEVNGADVLFSIATIKDSSDKPSFIQKIANAQVGINWTITLNIG